MQRALTLLEHWLVPALIAATALAVVPSLPSPFSTPKLAILIAGALLSALLASLRQASGSPLATATSLAFLLSIGISGAFAPLASLDAVLRDAAAGLLVFALARTAINVPRAALAIVAVGAAIAAVSLAQAAGLDPFAALGFRPEVAGARMRVYGTLGNPDFVAAWLAPALCVTAGELLASPSARGRALLGAALAAMAAALAATGSLASAPALAGATLAAVVALPATARRRAGVAVVAVLIAGALAAAAGAANRDLSRAFAGRTYLARVALPHVREAPVFGHGPGSFAALYPSWEADYWARTPDASERRFAAEQDHAHDDYLERALDTGLVGVAAFVALLVAAVFTAVRAARRGTGDWARAMGAAAGLVALGARAGVDFPFARPAELTLMAVLAAVCFRSSGAGAAARAKS